MAVAQVGSRIVVVTGDPALAAEIGEWLAPHGWSCGALAPDAIGKTPAFAAAAVLVDARAADAGEALAAVRAWPAPGNGTPVLAAGPKSDLALPLDQAAFLERLRQVAGPLPDHDFRREPWNFRYRLVRLLGLDAADAMLLRLRSALAEAVADPGAAPAHRLAGIAGMCGFPELAAAWSSVDRKETGARDPAIAASRRAIEQLDQPPGT